MEPQAGRGSRCAGGRGASPYLCAARHSALPPPALPPLRSLSSPKISLPAPAALWQEGWGKGRGAQRGCLVSSFSLPPPPPSASASGAPASPTPAFAIGSGRGWMALPRLQHLPERRAGRIVPRAATLRPPPASPARLEGLLGSGTEGAGRGTPPSRSRCSPGTGVLLPIFKDSSPEPRPRAPVPGGAPPGTCPGGARLPRVPVPAASGETERGMPPRWSGLAAPRETSAHTEHRVPGPARAAVPASLIASDALGAGRKTNLLKQNSCPRSQRRAPGPKELAGPLSQVGAAAGTRHSGSHRRRGHRWSPRIREPNALLELVKWNQINCSMDLVPFNQL
ncbi:uncharacterized protein AAES06_000904 isoform 1-T1 [Glossophaga mutica]